MEYYEKDPEKQAGKVNASSSPSLEQPYGVYDGEDNNAITGESFEYGNSWYAKLMRLAGHFNVEQRGIERVPEDERTDKGFKALLNVSTMVCMD